MAYATVDQLARALRGRVTPENTDDLQRCADAAALEIDNCVDRAVGDPIDPADPLAVSVNIARGCEWYKANDALFGAIGFSDTGTLKAPEAGFVFRYGATLQPLKRTAGVVA
jgi:hypothetical protein